MDRTFVRGVTTGAFRAFPKTPIQHVIVGRGIIGEKFGYSDGGALFCSFGGDANRRPVNAKERIISKFALGDPGFQ